MRSPVPAVGRGFLPSSWVSCVRMQGISELGAVGVLAAGEPYGHCVGVRARVGGCAGGGRAAPQPSHRAKEGAVKVDNCGAPAIMCRWVRLRGVVGGRTVGGRCALGRVLLEPAKSRWFPHGARRAKLG